MTDPFQDVDAGGRDFVQSVGDALEVRAAEPVMQDIVDGYLDQVDFSGNGLHLDIGTGTGAIARNMARRAGRGRVIGSDLSPGLIDYARARPDLPDNLSFEVTTGTALPQDDASVDTVVMHTLLSHVPDPAILVAEAARVLRPGGTLVICDADFAKITLSNGVGDPLDACAAYFAQHFVTDRFLVGKLRALVSQAGLKTRSFRVLNRVISEGAGGLTWVGMGGKHMVETGLISAELHAALVAEYHRRAQNGLLYGFMPFAVLIAQQPG
jgi:SAM-dependent methyltransferase